VWTGGIAEALASRETEGVRSGGYGALVVAAAAEVAANLLRNFCEVEEQTVWLRVQGQCGKSERGNGEPAEQTSSLDSGLKTFLTAPSHLGFFPMAAWMESVDLTSSLSKFVCQRARNDGEENVGRICGSEGQICVSLSHRDRG
jgi:hypothetical protein